VPVFVKYFCACVCNEAKRISENNSFFMCVFF
jgi:hypothetical protein